MSSARWTLPWLSTQAKSRSSRSAWLHATYSGRAPQHQTANDADDASTTMWPVLRGEVCEPRAWAMSPSGLTIRTARAQRRALGELSVVAPWRPHRSCRCPLCEVHLSGHHVEQAGERQNTEPQLLAPPPAWLASLPVFPYARVCLPPRSSRAAGCFGGRGVVREPVVGCAQRGRAFEALRVV